MRKDLTPDPAVYIKVCPVYMEDHRRHEFKASDLRQVYCTYAHKNLAKQYRWQERARLKKIEGKLVKGKVKKAMLARGIRHLGLFEALRGEALEKDKSTFGATTLADIHYSVAQAGAKGVKKSAPSFERAEKLRPEMMEFFTVPREMWAERPEDWLQ